MSDPAVSHGIISPPRLVDLQRPPLPPSTRVPVTNSTLFAYQAMRGNNDKSQIQFGPLHASLYFYPADGPLEYRYAKIDLPNFPKEPVDMLDGLPSNLLLFWDSTTPLIPGAVTNIESEAKKETPHKLFNNNHYSDPYGLANYGYAFINGKWVDPDSSGDILGALTCPTNSPGARLPYVSPEPHIMTGEEENEFYGAYLAELGENEDYEGDPRHLRISPATFARWATGATQGDWYEKKDVPSGDSWKKSRIRVDDDRRNSTSKAQTTSRIVRIPQFDVETGSVMSGEYDFGGTPSPLLSAQGVDLHSKPDNFSRMAPLVNREIDLAAFGAQGMRERIEEWLASSIASSTRVLNSEGAREGVGSPGNAHCGEQRYEQFGRRIHRLRQERMAGHTRNQHKFSIAHDAAAMKLDLCRENAFLQKELEGRRALAESPPPATTQKSQQGHSKRGYYHRYLEEAEYQEKIEVARNDMASKQIDEDLKGTIQQMAELGDLNRMLRESFKEH